MSENRNRNVGEEIQDIVQNAVASMDFKRLNNEITTSVNSALAEVRTALGIQISGDRQISDEPKAGTWRPDSPQIPKSNNPKMQGDEQRNAPKHANINEMQNGRQLNARVQPPFQNQQNELNREYRQANYGQKGQSGQPRTFVESWKDWAQVRQGNNAPVASITGKNQPTKQLQKGVRIPYIPKGRISGTLLSIFGSIGSIGFGISLFTFCILAMSIQGGAFPYLILGFIPAFAVSLLMMNGGSVARARIKRMKAYLKQLQYRGFCSIKELANATGQSERFVKKDIKRMLSLGMFPEGSLDETGSCFMATRGSVEQYLLAQQGYEQRKIEDNRRLVEEQERLMRQNIELKNKIQGNKTNTIKDPYSSLSPEVRATIKEGREHIRLIKEANEAIPAEDISAKLDRLELVIDRILYHIEKHPKQLPEIRKFMDYYLPTTLKLVNAYRVFDSQPLQGENISTAKAEIRKTLDTINTAFEKLLDSMFEDAAMDVSTDITVLETMFAQEGLTESDFPQEEIKLKL